jgi:hypothetical protein
VLHDIPPWINRDLILVALFPLVDLFGQIRRRTADLKIYAYANNHYQGHGPATVKLLWDLYKVGSEALGIQCE